MEYRATGKNPRHSALLRHKNSEDHLTADVKHESFKSLSGKHEHAPTFTNVWARGHHEQKNSKQEIAKYYDGPKCQAEMSISIGDI